MDSQRTLNLALAICVVCSLTEALQFLSYVQIDYEHYYKLAQCQALCTEKYGNVAIRRRLDGSTRSFFNTSNHGYSMCELGCTHARIGTKKTTTSRSLLDPFTEGQNFWRQALEHQRQKSTFDKKVTPPSPLQVLRPICSSTASSMPGNGILDSYKVVFTALPRKPEFVAPMRLLVQWKQRVGDGASTDETKWITAAIEPDLTFTAEGVQPGIHYKVMVTLIGVNGRIGQALTSDWIMVPPLGTAPSADGFPIVVTPQFNTDDNVSAILSFRRHIVETAFKNHKRHQHQLLTPTCTYMLRYTNSSKHIQTHHFELDESEGLLLRNLAFSTDYSVELLPISNQTHNMVEPLSRASSVYDVPRERKALARFRTISCAEVFGAGSFQCEPEPVRDLDIQLNLENSTVTVSWKPSAEQKMVLLYEITYMPILDTSGCDIKETTLYLSAQQSQSEIPLVGAQRCEVEVRVTNYDLRGREASVTARFHYLPSPQLTLTDTIDATRARIMRHFWLLLAIPILLGLGMVVVIRLVSALQRRLKRVVQIRNKESEKPLPAPGNQPIPV